MPVILIVDDAVENVLMLKHLLNDIGTIVLRKFKAAVDSSSAAILITDRDARIEYVNAAFSDITGYTPNEMIGSVPELLRSGATVEDGIAGERDLWQIIMDGSRWRGE